MWVRESAHEVAWDVHVASTAATSAITRPRGGPDADQGAHQQPHIEAADVDIQALQDIAVLAQVRAPHRAGLVEMRVRPFQPLAPSALPRAATRTAEAPTIRITTRRASPGARPSPPAALWLGDVGPQI